MAGFSHISFTDNGGHKGSSEMTSYWGDDTVFKFYLHICRNTSIPRREAHHAVYPQERWQDLLIIKSSVMSALGKLFLRVL